MPAPSAVDDFLDVMHTLRRECAWTASQTHESLRPYLLEEAEEVAEAIDSGDPDKLRDELGDLLFQVFYHSAIAEERGDFTFDDVVVGLTAKLKRRNRHVFGDLRGTNPSIDEIHKIWNDAKAAERGFDTPAATQPPTDAPAATQPPVIE